MPEIPNQFAILGMPLHILEDYPGWLANRLAQGQGSHVVTLNAEMTMQAEINPELAEVIQRADLVIPDGAGVVLYLKLHGQQIRRCPGIELAEALIYRSVTLNPPWSLFFFGGAPGVAETAARNWCQQVPNLVIAGTQHGYLNAEEEITFRRTLEALQPQLIFVGLGVPRQEHWIVANRHLCPHAVWIGVGGSLDIWAGTKSRAPHWLRNNNLEWFYRLWTEPWRWRRMLALPRFAWRALVTKLE